MGCPLLFPVPDNKYRNFVIWLQQPVSPDLFAYCGHTQGPQPAKCVRDHPNDPWHWDGRGTWWRGDLSWA